MCQRYCVRQCTFMFLFVLTTNPKGDTIIMSISQMIKLRLCISQRGDFQQVPTVRHPSAFSAISESQPCRPHQVWVPAGRSGEDLSGAHKLGLPSHLLLPSSHHSPSCSAASSPCLQSSANHSLGSTLCLQILCGFCLLAGP